MEASRHEKQPVDDLRLWYGVAAGPIIWILHLAVVYALASLSCERGFLRFEVMGVIASSALIVILTIIAVALVIFAGVLSYGSLQRIRADPDVSQPEASRYRFMAFSGIILSIIFAITILISAIPTLLLTTCHL
jgi:heme/copper-type cytochrome/quinol oxidase subunit 2